MPIDPSIPLQTQVVNPTNFISGFLDLGIKRNQLDKSTATLDADIAQRKAESSSAQSTATVNAANVNPLIRQQAASTRTAETGADAAKYRLTGEQAAMGRQIAGALLNDPSITDGDTDAILGKISEARQTMIASGVPAHIAEANTAGLIAQALRDPKQVQQTLKTIVLQGNLPPAQAGLAQPNGPVISNGTSTTQYNTNPFAGQPGPVVGVSAPTQVGPGSQEEIQTDAEGRRYIVQRSPQGVIVSTRPVPGSTTGGGQAAGPVNLPQNETTQARDSLQAERQTALQQVQNAGNLHQLNREIYSIADGDVQSGKLGALITKVSSATGFNLGEGVAADYNTLGKMLARSNQQLAQGMGPHTNAGLEQTNAANGTLEYDKNTIKKIANLNDALVTGTQMYQKGLEAAIERDGIFGKRKFDQAWGNTFDPDVMRLKNAVDNRDFGQIQMIIKQSGGKGSAGARALFEKLQKLDALAGGAQ